MKYAQAIFKPEMFLLISKVKKFRSVKFMSVNFNTAAQQQYQPQYQQYSQDYTQQQPQQVVQPAVPPQTQVMPEQTTVTQQTQVMPEQTTVAQQPQTSAQQHNYTYIPQVTQESTTTPVVDPQVYINNQTQNYNIPQQTISQQATQGYEQMPAVQQQPQTVIEKPVQPSQPKVKRNLWETIKSDEAALWTGVIVSTAALLMYAFAPKRVPQPNIFQRCGQKIKNAFSHLSYRRH